MGGEAGHMHIAYSGYVGRAAALAIILSVLSVALRCLELQLLLVFSLDGTLWPSLMNSVRHV